MTVLARTCMHDSFCQLLLKLTQLALQHHVLLEIPFTSYS